MLRQDGQATFADYAFAPVEFIRYGRNSIDVTAGGEQSNIQNMLASHGLSYAWYDLQDAFALGETPAMLLSRPSV